MRHIKPEGFVYDKIGSSCFILDSQNNSTHNEVHCHASNETVDQEKSINMIVVLVWPLDTLDIVMQASFNLLPWIIEHWIGNARSTLFLMYGKSAQPLIECGFCAANFTNF